MENVQIVLKISDAQKAEIERLEAEDRYTLDSITKWAVEASREQLIATNFANICEEVNQLDDPARSRIQRSLEVLQCLGVK